MTAVEEIVLRSAYDERKAFATGPDATLFRGRILALFQVRANIFRPDGDPGCAGCPIKSSHLSTTRHG